MHVSCARILEIHLLYHKIDAVPMHVILRCKLQASGTAWTRVLPPLCWQVGATATQGHRCSALTHLGTQQVLQDCRNARARACV
jgi:hypothetical protein